MKLHAQLRRAVQSFPGDTRIAIIGSGGLTHYVIEEDFDLAVLRDGLRLLARLSRAV